MSQIGTFFPASQQNLPSSLLKTLAQNLLVEDVSLWPDEYTNSKTGRAYKPHHEDERRFVYEDGPWRYGLAKGGEGGGKSVAGIIKTLHRLRRGMSGIMVGTDLEHFKKSLWKEFRLWCPWQCVVKSQRYRQAEEWEPTQSFSLVFYAENGKKVTLMCGGIESPSGWEGPNVSFAHFDEARRHREPDALKVLDGRIRITGPNGEQPQLYLTTTPRKHWLFDYFGDLRDDHPYPAFRKNALVVDLLTAGNADNLASGYVEQRRQSLTEQEARVLLEAAWEDIDDTGRFVQSMLWWDACKAEIPTLDEYTPMVLALDAAVSGDTFGVIGVTRHWERDGDAAVRLVRPWIPQRGVPLNFEAIEQEIRWICDTYNVVCLTYDPYQLHQMSGNLGQIVWCDAFGQGTPRLIADNQLLQLIKARRITHDGNSDLRQHIDNADRKLGTTQEQLRIVKRSEHLKVDLAVALSMAVAKCLELNL